MTQVVDPVCKMTLDSAAAAASVEFGGERIYFCSTICRDSFLANPSAYRSPPVRRTGPSPNWAALGVAAGSGTLGGTGLLTVYLGVLTLVSGWAYALGQFATYWPFIVALAAGFAVQVGLFVFLRRAAHAGSGKVVAVTGTTSGAAMVSCCAHYAVNLLPVLGATGLVSLVGQYQVELFWVGLAANLAGIVYMGRRLAPLVRA